MVDIEVRMTHGFRRYFCAVDVIQRFSGIHGRAVMEVVAWSRSMQGGAGGSAFHGCSFGTPEGLQDRTEALPDSLAGESPIT